MNFLMRFWKKTTYLEDNIGLIFFIIMLGITFFNVIMRYVFHSSWSFSEEFTTNALVLLSLLGAAASARDGEHFSMTYISDMLPDNYNNLLMSINNFLCFIMSVILLVTGFEYTITQYAYGSLSVSMKIPNWIYGSTIPIGCFFLCVRFMERAIRHFNQFLKKGVRLDV